MIAAWVWRARFIGVNSFVTLVHGGGGGGRALGPGWREETAPSGTSHSHVRVIVTEYAIGAEPGV